MSFHCSSGCCSSFSAHGSFFFCALFWFSQQKVYEVKLEDGNVYVKHASSLSLQPFPVDGKSWSPAAFAALWGQAVAKPTQTIFKDWLHKTKPSETFLGLIWRFHRPFLLRSAYELRMMSDCPSRTWHHEIVAEFFLLPFQKPITDTGHREQTDNTPNSRKLASWA